MRRFHAFIAATVLFAAAPFVSAQVAYPLQPGVDNGRQVYNIVAFKAVADDATDNAAFIQATVDAAAAGNGAVFIGAGTFKCLSQITVPANVEVFGTGPLTSIVHFTGATAGFVRIGPGSNVWDNIGPIHDFKILGDRVNTTIGLDIEWNRNVIVERMRIENWTVNGLFLSNNNKATVERNFFYNNGSSTSGNVKIDRTTTPDFSRNYVAGSAVAPGYAGLELDRSGNPSIESNIIEDCGIGINIGGATEGTQGVVGGMIAANDLEKCTFAYIELGAGWTGAASGAVQQLAIIGNSGSVSGSTNTPYGVWMANTDSIGIYHTTLAISSASGAVAHLWQQGTGNARLVANKNGVADAFPYLVRNGVTSTTARPDKPYEQVGSFGTIYWEDSNVSNAADTNWVSTTAYTLPGGKMATDGDELIIEALAQTSAAASTRTYQLNLGYSAFSAASGFTGGISPVNSNSTGASLLIEIKARIVRTSSTTAKFYSFNQISSGSLFGSSSVSTGSITWANDQNLLLAVKDSVGNAAAATIRDFRVTYRPK